MLCAYSYQRFKSVSFCFPPLSINFHSQFSTITYDEDLPEFFDHLLRQCNGIQHSKQVHSATVVTGAYCSAFVSARLVSIYSRYGLVSDARKVFGSAPFECLSNFLLWNSIIRANVYHGYCIEALHLYGKMRNYGVLGDGFTFPLVLRASSNLGTSDVCKNLHCHVVQFGFQNHLHVGNELIGMYAKLERMDDARKVFDKMRIKSVVSWNTMVSGYAYNYDVNGASRMFHQMELEGVEPNPVTWTSLLSSHARCGHLVETMVLFCKMRMKGVGATAEMLAVVLSVCADLATLNSGQMIHGYMVKGGFNDYLFAKNALITLYGKGGDVGDAEKLFHEMKVKNLVSWNALISSFAESGVYDKALELLSQLEKMEAYPEMKPNVITWSSIICGFSSKGLGEESLEVFRKMQLANVKANSVTIASVLSICAMLAALNLGRELHGHVIRAWMDNNVLVGNGLINMYTKCGSFKPGLLVFEKLENRDSISWNSMIAGYGTHGLGKDALATVNHMIKSGYRPDGVTFIAALSACSHAGLVAEGHWLFSQMRQNFKIEPEIEHYACMVDLLGRAGLVEEASNIIKSMPMEPNAYIWSSLLNSCRMHKDTDLAEEAAAKISNLNSKITGSHMLLSNIFAASCRWEDSARVRISARIKGLKKVPGWSWIEVKKKVYIFKAGYTTSEGLEKVDEILHDLAFQIENYDSDDLIIE
ncbi:hypothetical protein IC582_008135 [Cucumis melo]|uniref:Pentatricopeptide repeat-containing protein At1g17630 n=1 Tax=Cucumis melo TaxID=3656 RepID=A0A1S3BIG8_CUCME|nr:putative pentatricopeptide repeat-containing protein At1g17630 [Cucumis melo]